MGYLLIRLDEPVFMAGPKPMRTEFGIHQRLESCGIYYITQYVFVAVLQLSKYVTIFLFQRFLLS